MINDCLTFSSRFFPPLPSDSELPLKDIRQNLLWEVDNQKLQGYQLNWVFMKHTWKSLLTFVFWQVKIAGLPGKQSLHETHLEELIDIFVLTSKNYRVTR